MSRILVTGGAGFIGSHLVDALVGRGQDVVVFDNLSTGRRSNLDQSISKIRLIEGDIRDLSSLRQAMKGVESVFHEAALGSVVRSIEDPILAHEVNATGTLNVLCAAKEAGVKRLVYASSSSVYGSESISQVSVPNSSDERAPKREGMKPSGKSPYAVSKLCGEEYVRIFGDLYGLEGISLRYFNVFGPRQDPGGPYGAVVPLFVQAILARRSPVVNGDGCITRDFTYVSNVVQANLMALDAPSHALGRAYNVGTGVQVNLLELIACINAACGADVKATFGRPRVGDVAHSLASIALARKYLGYIPTVSFEEGIRKTVEFYAGDE